MNVRLVPVAARSKAGVCGRSPAEIVGLNPTGGHECLSVVSDVYCQVEVSVTDWSLVQRSPTDCGESCVWPWNFLNEEALSTGGGGVAVTPKTATMNVRVFVPYSDLELNRV